MGEPIASRRQVQCMLCRVDKRSGPRCRDYDLCQRCSTIKGLTSNEHSLLSTEFLDWKGWFIVRRMIGDLEEHSHNMQLPTHASTSVILEMCFRDRLSNGMMKEYRPIAFDMSSAKEIPTMSLEGGKSHVQALRLDVAQLDHFVRTHVWTEFHQVGEEDWVVEEEQCLLETVQLFTGYLGLLKALPTTTINPMSTFHTLTPVTVARELVFTFVFRLQALFYEIGLHCNAILRSSSGDITSTPTSNAMETVYRILKSLIEDRWSLPSEPQAHPLIELRKEVVSRAKVVLSTIAGFECVCSGKISKAAKMPVPPMRDFAASRSGVNTARFPQECSITVHDLSRPTVDSSGFDTIESNAGQIQSVFDLLSPERKDALSEPGNKASPRTFVDLDNREIDVGNLLQEDRQRRKHMSQERMIARRLSTELRSRDAEECMGGTYYGYEYDANGEPRLVARNATPDLMDDDNVVRDGDYFQPDENEAYASDSEDTEHESIQDWQPLRLTDGSVVFIPPP